MFAYCVQSITHPSAQVEISAEPALELQTWASLSYARESCRQLEATPKYQAKFSHGDFRRFFYKATVNSMPKNKKLDGTGREGLFSEIKAQFKPFHFVSDEQNRPSF